jgi:hypothetical protein
MSGAGPTRAQRLLGGWSANLLQLILGITQQVALVPLFVRYSSGDVLAAWLALYAAGSLALIADSGLQPRAINRFFSFKSSVDSEGRTARYYAAMRRIYFGLTGLLIAFLLIITFLFPPSRVLGFHEVANFDASFAIIVGGMLLILPVNPATALYRTRGLYGRAVWMQNAALFVAQLGQAVAIVATGNLIAIALAFVVPQIISAAYLVGIDAYRQCPFLRRGEGDQRLSWHFIVGQFRRALPFAVAGSTEIALQNLPVLLVSAIVVDRVAVAQWGLTRIVAGLVRGLCVQATLPLAAELGHDRVIGAVDALRRLYARGSVFLMLLASVVVSGLLAFWPDFFALWTHGVIPYDPLLALTLLIGAQIVAPAMLALGFAYHSDRGDLLVRTKGAQLIAFLALSLILTPRMGPLGTAIAIVASDVLIQFGLLFVTIIWQTLERPFAHILLLTGLAALVTAFGWGLGSVVRSAIGGSGLAPFVAGCAVWLASMVLVASPLANRRLRTKLADFIPA